MIPLFSDPAHHTVVTTDDGRGAPLGTAAASAGAVSLTPPLVLACIDEGSATLAAVLSNRRFALNVLPGPIADAPLSGAPRPELLDPLATRTVDGVPTLDGAAATVRCELHDIADGGPLTLLVGRVVGVREIRELT